MGDVKEDKRIYVMASERPVKAVLKMGVPVTVGMMFMVIYNIVDTYFIGRLGDDCQMAAVNLAYPVLMVIIAISGIVGNGGASYMARCIGAGKMDEARHTLTIGLEMMVIGSAVLAAAGIALIDPVTSLLGADETTFEYTKQYVSIMFAGDVFIIGNYAVGQLLRAEGSTFYSMVGMVAGMVINIILDPIFIFTLGMEIRGAAIATIIGNGAAMLIY